VILHVIDDDSFGELVFKRIFKEHKTIDMKVDELKDVIIDLSEEIGSLKRIEDY
jgi:hypothetical protein